jgi:riboflavin kinase
MVMNIGSCPTVKEGDADVTVEAHIVHKYLEDFYGKNLKVVALGYIRPEMKFSGLQSLLTRIKTDIGIAKNQLDDPAYAGSKSSL